MDRVSVSKHRPVKKKKDLKTQQNGKNRTSLSELKFSCNWQLWLVRKRSKAVLCSCLFEHQNQLNAQFSQFNCDKRKNLIKSHFCTVKFTVLQSEEMSIKTFHLTSVAFYITKSQIIYMSRPEFVRLNQLSTWNQRGH